MKQVTGHENHDVQGYIVGVVTGAVPQDFLIAIGSAMDLQYHCQATELDDNNCDNILAALQEFHQHKFVIMDAAAQVGKGGWLINSGYILKLELPQSVVPNIQANSTTIQILASNMEHAHYTKIKNPAQTGNNQQYEAQICCNLDCTNKMHHFDLCTAI